MTQLQRIENEALTLPPKDRAHLIHDLIQSLDPQHDVKSDYEEVIKQRVNRIKSNRAFGISAEDVFARIQERH